MYMSGRGEHLVTSDKKFIYSGHDRHHIEGDRLLMNKFASHGLIQWRPISSRLLFARFKSGTRNVPVIQSYAPTEVSDADKKRDFTASSQQLL